MYRFKRNGFNLDNDGLNVRATDRTPAMTSTKLNVKNQTSLIAHFSINLTS
jgi:hypothetical protein